MTDECERCGDALAGAGYEVEAEYPPESFLDPGRFHFRFCGDCARALATDVLVCRGVNRDIPVYHDVTAARTPPDRRRDGSVRTEER